MKARKLILISSFITIISVGASTQVADINLLNSQEIVLARKQAMVVISEQVGILRVAVRREQLKVAKAAASSIASLAGTSAPLYKNAFTDVYPVSGSRYKFKSGDEFELSEKFAALHAAAKAAATAKEISEINVQSIQGTCAGCHSVFRR